MNQPPSDGWCTLEDRLHYLFNIGDLRSDEIKLYVSQFGKEKVRAIYEEWKIKKARGDFKERERAALQEASMEAPHPQSKSPVLEMHFDQSDDDNDPKWDGRGAPL